MIPRTQKQVYEWIKDLSKEEQLGALVRAMTWLSWVQHKNQFSLEVDRLISALAGIHYALEFQLREKKKLKSELDAFAKGLERDPYWEYESFQEFYTLLGKINEHLKVD